MEVFMKVLYPILVLMFFGTGFIYVHAMTDSLASFCFDCIE